MGRRIRVRAWNVKVKALLRCFVSSSADAARRNAYATAARQSQCGCGKRSIWNLIWSACVVPYENRPDRVRRRSSVFNSSSMFSWGRVSRTDVWSRRRG